MTPTKHEGEILTPRKHLVASAEYWYNAGYRAIGTSSVFPCMQNAYNHVENALSAEQEKTILQAREIESLRAALVNAKGWIMANTTKPVHTLIETINSALANQPENLK